jgi:3-hydroxyisobutyrate dehydrogenase-like beta-hydroxyacid dehydrogenase
VLTCLDSEAASEQVLLGVDGVVARARAGAVLADHATIGPELARKIGAAAVERGLGFLDAPVSGGPEGAEQGTLTIMAGGTEANFARAEPVFRSYGKTVVRMGDVGAGSNTKLINQLLTFVHGTAAAEALVLAERLGLTPAAVGAVLRASFGQSRMLERTMERVHQGNYLAGAALRLYAKDLKLIETTAAAAGAEVPVTRAVEAVLERALERGMGDLDIAALYRFYLGEW